jgi:diaminopimelate epimerase
MSPKKFSFTKLVASGNDFVLLDLRRKTDGLNLKTIAQNVCHRKFGIGADGLLVLEKSKRADVKMRIFNADGSEAEMCGNGARCVVYFLISDASVGKKQIKIETKAGILKAQANKGSIRINMTDPRNVKLNLMLSLNKHPLRLSFINTGVPHCVILCEGIERIDVHSLGRLIRFHRKFKPAGTNVNFVEPSGLNRIKIRTYERGVEEETLACGTGSVAAAIVYILKLMKAGLVQKENKFNVNVDTVSDETLKVYFEIFKNKICNVWLEGKASMICKGDFYV